MCKNIKYNKNINFQIMNKNIFKYSKFIIDFFTRCNIILIREDAIMNSIGVKLKELRKKQNISQ